VWLLKIVYVAPVVRRGFGRGFLLQELAHGRVFARPVWPQGKEVKALTLNTNPKTDRLQSPCLADYRLRIVQLGRGSKRELAYITRLVQCFR
jgi:hypothetical protein